MPTDRKFHIVGVSGSKRPENYTGKALRIALQNVSDTEGCTSEIVDPVHMKLLFPGEAGDKSDAEIIKKKLKAADGIILATPEYHGSFSSVIKVILENLGFPSALKGKPVTLLGVAQGKIGAIKSLESLRGVCSHIGCLVLPGPISISGVQDVINEKGVCMDPATEKTLQKSAQNLVDFLFHHTCPELNLESLSRTP